MNKVMTLEQVDALVDKDDRYFWETYGLRLIKFTPARTVGRDGKESKFFPISRDAFYNRRWRRGKGHWGRAKYIEVGDDGLFKV